MERATTDTEHRESLDRLTLLLITRPEEGWEKEFNDISRREIERLATPNTEIGRERDE